MHSQASRQAAAVLSRARLAREEAEAGGYPTDNGLVDPIYAACHSRLILFVQKGRPGNDVLGTGKI